MARKRKKLGEILVSWGTVSDQEVSQGLSIAKGSGKRLGEAMVEAGLCKEDDVAKALAAQFDMETSIWRATMPPIASTCPSCPRSSSRST